MGGELYLSASSEPGQFHKPEPKSLRNQCRPMEVDAAPLKEVEGTSSACERVFTLGSGSGALPSAHIELWRKGQLCDMELTAGGQSFSAHRYVMAGASAYVRTRLAAHMGDSKSCIEVADQPPEVLSALLNFIYTGTCCVGESQLCSLLHAASFFQVDALQGVCEKELTEKELTDENVLEAWLVADSLTLPTLDAAAQAKASANFEKLSATPAFARLRPHMLTALVQSESLQLTSEENVHHAILAWGAAQAPPASVETLLSMLQHVRYPHCSYEFVQEVRRSLPLASCQGESMLLDLFQAAWFSRGARVPRRTPDKALESELLVAPQINGATQVTWRLEAPTGSSKHDFEQRTSVHSPSFTSHEGSCSWKLCLFPYGNGSHSLALYLVPADVTSLPVGWSRKISFELSVVNATDAEKSVIKEAEHTFSRKVVDWGYRDLIELSQLHAPEGGFIVDGKMVISAKIWAADPDEEED